MSSQKERRQKQLAVVGAIGHEHFMTGVRMLYACRYQDALAHFQEAAILEPHSRGYLSYLGLATAHAHRKYSDAEQLCRRAIEAEYHRPEHYFNLAEVFTLAGRKSEAIKSYNQSLSWNPSYEPALDALRKLGMRRPPVLPSLPRSHPINVLLGKTFRKKARPVQLAR
ncbi:MAG TPA: tetratricopeptide repeat protein [Candidatus Limnocylindrales bacterium]|nr:tetratricopeptide repeat protein [Candidatus Limnocylindrales bacterium]